jgi:hypothetical protein
MYIENPTYILHCKKRFAIKLFPAKESLVCDIPDGDGNIANLDLKCKFVVRIIQICDMCLHVFMKRLKDKGYDWCGSTLKLVWLKIKKSQSHLTNASLWNCVALEKKADISTSKNRDYASLLFCKLHLFTVHEFELYGRLWMQRQKKACTTFFAEKRLSW